MRHLLLETLDEAVLQRISGGPHVPGTVMEVMEWINNSPGAPAGTDWQALRGTTIAD